MATVDDYQMRHRVKNCLRKVELVLDANRNFNAQSADHVSHSYEDKYELARVLTNTALSCTLNAWSALGLDKEKLRELKEWSKQRSVSLKFEHEQKCVFVREIERDEEDPTRVQAEGASIGLIKVKVITKIKEYVYKVTQSYDIIAFCGVGDTLTKRIYSNNSEIEVITRSTTSPFPEVTKDGKEVNISWALQRLNATCTATDFSIDRSNKTCFTPRRNKDIGEALAFFQAHNHFAVQAISFMNYLHDFQKTYGKKHECRTELASFHPASVVFNPVVPLFVEPKSSASQQPALTDGSTQSGTTAVQFSASDANKLLEEQHRSLQAMVADAENRFIINQNPSSSPSTSTSAVNVYTAYPTVFTVKEGRLLIIFYHALEIAQHHQAGVDFIEQMLRAQLVAAVGKELTMKDFSQYMVFHNRKVLKEAYAPRPFSHSVRRTSAHSPEGVVKMELIPVDAYGVQQVAEPLYTVSASVGTDEAPSAVAPMEFAVSATTKIRFKGERHVHGWMAHRFSGQALPSLRLVAQARQFSSFVVLIGRINSAKSFDPKYAFITQNKDEFTIPLDLEQIPSAKEFKDAIESLSPEQQRFAKAFRSMQLESTLFGVLVIQIKPQLECVLQLSPDSLTKEIKLTQELMELFIKYQIPSDLLSFDPTLGGGSQATAVTRLEAVKRHVKAMQEMIQIAKDEEIAAANQQREYERGPPPPPSYDMDFLDLRNDLTIDSVENCVEAVELCQHAGVFKRNAAPVKRSSLSGIGKMFFGASAPSRPAPAPSSAAPPARLSGCAPGAVSGAKSSSSSVSVQKKDMVMRKESAAPAPKRAEESRSGAVKNTASSSVAATTTTTTTVAAAQPTAGKQQQSSSQSQQQQQQPSSVSVPSPPQGGEQGTSEGEDDSALLSVDYTQYPNLLEAAYTRVDPEAALCPTIINPATVWSKSSQAGLMAKAVSTSLNTEQQDKDKTAAFDLLDALTRSGALVLEHAALHVVIAATHCFDDCLIDTIVQKNVNPIERVERSTLIMASTLHAEPVAALVNESQLERVLTFSPMLLTNEESE